VEKILETLKKGTCSILSKSILVVEVITQKKYQTFSIDWPKITL